MSNEESFNENSASDQTTTKMASYADASKTENDKSKAQNSDFGFSAAKPVFILETDLFGTIKPKPVDFLNHAELYSDIGHVVEESHLKGLQRVNGMWRIYLDSESDREHLIANGLTIRKKHIHTGHKQETCDNDWVCNSCGKSGHKAKECQQPMDDPTADQDQNGDSIVTDSVPEAANIDNAQDETKDKQLPSESCDDSNDDSEDDEQQLVVSKECKQITTNNEQTNKNKSNKQNLPKSASGPMDHYMNFKDPKTPSQSTGKRQATTPTDELHKRVVEPTKQKTNP
ncbi:CNBP [Mytilus edulis]|uniref:CNBP n=1 Tax=Mytilus edulis TaxID=6550 RepID=A0A8S3QN27_MYTED|nr:CNBP [Mytilus edulis]